jgi:hypothetical protein
MGRVAVLFSALHALVKDFKEEVTLDIGNYVLSFGLKTIGKEGENGIHKLQRQQFDTFLTAVATVGTGTEYIFYCLWMFSD